MSDDFCFDESDVLNGTLHISDDKLDEEYEEHLRTERQAAVAEAMQEALEEFSSFEDSSCEDDDTSCEEDIPENCNSVTPPVSFQPGLRLNASTHTSSPTIKTQVRSHSIPEGLNRSDVLMQHHGALTNGECRLFRAETHCLSASVDNLMHVGTQPGKFSSPSSFNVTDPSDSQSHCRYVNHAIESPDQRHQNYVKVQTGFHYQFGEYNPNCKGQGDSVNVRSENVDWNLTSLDNKKTIQATDNQPWTNDFSDKLHQHISTSDNVTSGRVSQDFQSGNSNNFMPCQNGYHMKSEMTDVRGMNERNGDDEWMMHIQKPIKVYTQPDHTRHQHPHQFSHHHHQLRHQAVDYSQDSELNHNLLVQSASAHPNTSLVSTKLMPPSTEAHISAAALSRQVGTVASRDVGNVQQMSRNVEVHDGGDGRSVQYKVHYEKPGLGKLEEEQFYLDNENVEFLHIDGSEDQRTSQQLEILYRARGRKIEELTRQIEEKDEEKSKEIRNLKHRLAIASGDAEAVSETLRQGQQLLQQSKSDNSEACGKIRALETQVSSLRDMKEELLQKLQTAESTIENLTHHIEELQKSESLSRARNEHESVVASLISRHERELLLVREKLDDCKTSLEDKQEELVCVKKQLADMARELDLMQVSKAETVNRLSRSLEESQRQCQAILEQSSSPEVSMMRVQLQQAVASKRISEDLCQTFQREIKELKEQLSMFESASHLGVFTTASSSASIPSHDDSMTDLGIRKTLNFDSPQSVPRHEDAPASEKLIASLKSELERCLCSNRQKRSEVTEKVEEVKVLKEKLEETQSTVASLEKTCADQKMRLQELDKPGVGGVNAVEARLQREIEDLKRDINALLADIEDYKKRLQEVGDSEAKLAEINAELNHQIAQMVNDFDLDKQSALQSCQRMMEAVNRQSFDKLRQDIEERFQSEKAMLLDDSKRKLDHLNQALKSTQAELDNVKSLYVKTCEEHSQREAELKESYRTQLEEELGKTTEKLEKEKKEWEHFMRDQMEKERDQIRDSLRQSIESEVKEDFQRKIENMVLEAKLACIEEQRLIRQTMTEEALADAKKLWQTEHERDIQQWAEERDVYESKLSSKNDELSEYKQKLDLAVSEKEQFQKLAEDLELDHQTNVESLETKYKEEVDDVIQKYERQILHFEEKLVEMYQQLVNSLDKKLDDVVDVSESFQDSNLLGKLHFLEDIMNEKDVRLQELEKMLQERKVASLLGVSKTGSNLNNLNGSFADLECYHGDLSEASVEKLKEHIKNLESDIKNLESELHTMKQKHNKEVNELKQQHQKEFENASRLREDKFQVELHYFLKEKDDQCKIRMEDAVKQCESQAKLQLDQALKKADEKLKCVVHETICEFENKNAELQKIKPSESKSVEDTFSLRDKMKHKISVLEDKYITEKVTLERKLKQIEDEKDDEIVNLCLRQAEEERKLKEQFDNDLASLKVEHQNIIRQLEQELSVQKSDADKAQELIELLKKENESNKLIVEELKKEVEQTKVSISCTESFTEQVKEERAKWFLEAQEYINKEIKQGVEDEIKKEGGKVREKLETIKEEERKVRQKLEKIYEEERKVREKQEKIQKDEEKVGEKLEKIQKDEEKVREKQEKIQKDEEKVREKLEKIKEDEEKVREMLGKIKEEEEKMREKLEKIKEGEEKVREKLEKIQEWEKNKEIFERKRKEETRNIILIELENLKKKFVVEVNERIETKKSQMEQQKMAWQEEERQKFLKEKEKIIKTLHSDMEMSLQEAKIKIEMKMEKVKESQLWEMRNEMQGEMRKRIQSVREEWEREKKDDVNMVREELEKLKECLEMEVNARIKASQERDKAVDHMKYQELLFQEEEQRLMSVLKKCQEDKEDASKRQEAVAEHVNNIDKKYKLNMKKLKTKSNQMPHSGPRNMASQKVQHHEPEKATSSHVDPLTQIHSALTQISAPVVGKEVIDIFNVRAKTNIRSVLSQQVPENMITALEHSLDLLSEHVKSMTAKGSNSDSASSRPGSGKYNSCRQQRFGDDDDVSGNKQINCQVCSNAHMKNMAVIDQHFQQFHLSHHSQNNHKEVLEEQKSHPQLDKVDLFDSDGHQHSSSSSNSSSPVCQTCIQTHLKPVTRNQQSAASNMQKCLPNEVAKARTTPIKLEATNETNYEFSGLPSARDERKFVEDRVRLENWTQTGEMPWKSPRKMSGTQLHDANIFIKPGLDTEQWVGQQKDNSHFLTNSSKHANISKQEQHLYNQIRVPEDSSSECSVGSDDASTSFITLQSDIDPIAARNFNSLKFSKNDNTAFMHKDDHLRAEVQVFRENKQQMQQSEYNHGIDFGSQMPVGCVRGKHASLQNVINGYSQRCRTPSPSSVLTKVKMTDEMRTKSEDDGSGLQWRNIGGPLVCDVSKDDVMNRTNFEPRQSSRSKFRSQSSQPNSSRLRTNSRSKSAERNNGDLVMKSTEFSSDASRINQNTEQTNLWRYKSLEELIPSLNQQNIQMKNVKADQKNTMERKNIYADYDQAPVLAMTSKFWEQQCVNDTVEQNGYHDYKQFEVNQPGYSQFGSETTHKKEIEKCVSPLFNQNSSPARHKISKRNKKQLSGSKMNVEFTAANETECDLHTEPAFKRRTTRSTRDVAGLRRSLEEEELSQYYQFCSSHEDARKSKMTRALSEQSLHTIHFENYSQDQAHDQGSHIDDLVSTYTSSYFDLRPFLYDEHF